MINWFSFTFCLLETNVCTMMPQLHIQFHALLMFPIRIPNSVKVGQKERTKSRIFRLLRLSIDTLYMQKVKKRNWTENLPKV